MSFLNCRLRQGGEGHRRATREGGGLVGDWDGGDEVGARVEYAWAVGKGEFWVTHPFAVHYPIHRMRLVYGFRLSETVLWTCQ